MRILHYSLGLPPYRSGGLTKYCTDLMTEQAKLDNEIFLLFPGKMNFIKEDVNIKFYKKENKINVYELVNPLPVPLLNGISNPIEFMKTYDKKLFLSFIKQINIDIVHIHTFMGLPIEFLEACKDLNIKMVYTTHDYFGICPKVNLIDNKGELCKDIDVEKCLKCNKSAYSITTIKLLQSKIYRILKNKGIILKAKEINKKIPRKKNVKNLEVDYKIENNELKKNNFKKLLNYYYKMFKHIDSFIYNSSIAENVYSKSINSEGKKISISHKDIKDNTKIKNFDSNKLRLTYLGPNKKYKGFDILIGAINNINKKYKNMIELNLYGDENRFEIDKNIKSNGKYSYRELEDIFNNSDLLIVPSIWYETFGFIVLEAMSYGVPVLVSNKVGAKDLIKNSNNGIIVDLVNESLESSIIKIIEDRNILMNINKQLCNDDKSKFSFENHYNDIMDYYKRVIYKN